ncbi:hypothetical protein C0993_000322 [Termitomyces sp. T159_Od127]|nr:hypothetical protein C0993_000322 [Termitomyces sp. T159_Od127]
MAGKFDPQNAQNLKEIEKQFAVKAVEQAQTYWNLLEKVSPRELKLTQHDDDIFNDTKKTFPELFENDNAKLIKLDENFLKSEDGKKKWRAFHALSLVNSACVRYEKKIKEHNFGCLIRTDADGEYGETSTIFVTRMQFYAIEISRNRLGLNDKAHEIAKEEAAKEAAKKEKEAKTSSKKTNGGK